MYPSQRSSSLCQLPGQSKRVRESVLSATVVALFFIFWLIMFSALLKRTIIYCYWLGRHAVTALYPLYDCISGTISKDRSKITCACFAVRGSFVSHHQTLCFASSIEFRIFSREFFSGKFSLADIPLKKQNKKNNNCLNFPVLLDLLRIMMRCSDQGAPFLSRKSVC